MIEHSSTVSRFIPNLLEDDIFTEANENLLLAELGLPADQPWPMKISLNTFILLLKIILKRKKPELILSLSLNTLLAKLKSKLRRTDA